MQTQTEVICSYQEICGGGVTTAQGIEACGVVAGFRKKPVPDLALVAASKPVTAAGVFTRNVFCAAPVTVSRAHVADGRARAIILNAGNANAATGEPGLATAFGTATLVGEALGCSCDEVLVASTGVIGQPLELDRFVTAIPLAVAALSRTGGSDAAHAIMTTDTIAKEYALEYSFEGVTYRIGGMVKGSGMIMPNMATMLAVITTDAPLDSAAAYSALKAAVDVSFNKVTVDSDTSTNDSCYLLATGEACGKDACEPIMLDTPAYQAFLGGLTQVCECLARKIASDGEGASKLITVNVTGAASANDAQICARSIANSPLVKTAVAGHDANWGRIAMAAGKSGAQFRQEDTAIWIMGIPVLEHGLPLAFDEDEALRRFEQPEVVLAIDLGAGEFSARIWTCDLTHDYISINADYRS